MAVAGPVCDDLGDGRGSFAHGRNSVGLGRPGLAQPASRATVPSGRWTLTTPNASQYWHPPGTARLRQSERSAGPRRVDGHC